MGKRVTHYARTGDHPACGKGTWIPPSRLTDSLTEVTCKNCQQTTCYRAEVFAADATATARAIRHVTSVRRAVSRLGGTQVPLPQAGLSLLPGWR